MSARSDDAATAAKKDAQVSQKRGLSGEVRDKRAKRRKDASAGKVPKAKRVGNFRSYYTYRLGQRVPGAVETDPRLTVLEKAWFAGRRGFDIGCNSGEFTISIARHMEPTSLLGVDADPDLISRARANLREVLQQEQIQKAFEEIADNHSANREERGEATGTQAPTEGLSDVGTDDGFAHEMPLSFRLWKSPAQGKGAVPRSIGKTATGTSFPLNVVFKRENIVSDTHSGGDYDFITCFSVTKWIHLFHGDDGIKAVFKKVFDLLGPGGRFIFEPQPWKSYHKRKFTSEITAANYDAIQLRPKDFPDFLTGTVGFRSCAFLQVCQTSAKGFRRPVYVAEKGS